MREVGTQIIPKFWRQFHLRWSLLTHWVTHNDVITAELPLLGRKLSRSCSETPQRRERDAPRTLSSKRSTESGSGGSGSTARCVITIMWTARMVWGAGRSRGRGGGCGKTLQFSNPNWCYWLESSLLSLLCHNSHFLMSCEEAKSQTVTSDTEMWNSQTCRWEISVL